MTDVQLLPEPEPKFGDWLRGVYASESNPHRDGMYVRTIRRSGRMNPGKYYELTDGKGEFWQYPSKSTERVDRANVAHATAAKDAEIEALRAEVRDLLRWNGDAEAMNDGLGRMLRDERARAERLAEALQLAVRQNSHDMLLTGDELRQCEAALHPTAAQGDEAASA